ncbi:MAG: type 1 glutamine amidotransferase [Rubrivivax sp.]
MKPVLILQHLSSDGPAYLQTWLERHELPFEVVDSERGGRAPADLTGHSALAILGGEMSANDDLPGLRDAEALFRLALEHAVPTLGHCLGGQLMARALGAEIGASPAPEIGWHTVTVADCPEAADWFESPGEHTVFQWHEEAFALPPQVVALAGSAACPHQAFSIGPHLAMQFHVELDAEKLQRWTHDASAQAIGEPRYASVQRPEQMLAQAAQHLLRQQALADRIYRCWIDGVGAS